MSKKYLVWNGEQEHLLTQALVSNQTAKQQLQHCVVSHFNVKAQEAIRKLAEANALIEEVIVDPYNTRGEAQ
ncbi:hypothetical protein NB573_21505 [Vibrio alginolyticus]|uniref:hypothetical protein n=1 Tax=Vibrio alginolyticus TaxID=663 RepID=UPI00215D22FC|nr:hypothetical protein [Vibrio alginolyticus]MCR9962631.1 hypothetical protein [Vibrio alginolyticus]